MNTEIRLAQPDDVDGIFNVRTSVIENPLSREELLQMGIDEDAVANMITQSQCAWVATVEGRVIGFSMILPDDGCLFAVFVLPEYEGRGIGRSLIKLAEQQLFSDHDVAWLETDKNSRAAGFYKRRGWGNEKDINGTDIRLEKHASRAVR